MDTELYDLTNPQKSIWLTEQFFKGTAINNICGTVIIDEVIDFEKLSMAINSFIKDNDAFRIHLLIDGSGNVKQYFSKYIPVQFNIEDVINNDELVNLETKMATIPFDVLEHDLYNIQLFRFPNGRGGFIVAASHLIVDACTASLLASKVMNIYSSLIKNEVPTEEPTSYLNYINSENEYLNSAKFEKDKEYWDEYFNFAPEFGIIPSLKKSSTESCTASRELFHIDTSTLEKINTFCKNNKISIFNFLMAVYSIYIGRVSNLEEFVLGTPILNRTTFVEKNTPGMFISTVPLKFSIAKSQSFVEYAQKIGLDCLSMFRHQKYPYQNILEHIRETNPSQPNLYDILISYQNSKTNRTSSDIPYMVRWTFNQNAADSMQIHIFDMNDENELNVAYDYRVDKYTADDINNVHNRILNIISQILDNPEISIDDIEIVTLEEKDMLLNKFNDTSMSYNHNKTVIDYFEEQVNKAPDNVALVCEGKEITYKKLNEEANKLANYLIQNNVKHKDIVGIMVHRSPEMIIGLIAILKIGATYLPIDPEYPTERINYILMNSKCNTVIVDGSTINLVGNNYKKIDIFSALLLSENSNIENLHTKISPNDLIYIIYTSGSTGNPKGVMVTHNNINNFILAEKQNIDFSPNKVILSVTTICFDIFALELWCSLTSGMKIILATDSEQTSPIALKKLCVKYRVNMIQTTPSRLATLLIDDNDIGFLNDFTDIMVGGESFPKVLLEKFHKYSRSKIFNMYGPTETTVWSTIKDLTNSDTITIGKPIANTTCYILDGKKRFLPPYVAGELYIGGDGVTNGYWNNTELTKSKFINSPFKLNEKIYNTNDLAYFTNNGEIVHLGRSDFQVKIRGYRIELEEIENKIIKHPNITNCIVNPVDNATKLCAYYTCKDIVNPTELRENLTKELPNYMIPNYFVKLDIFPYTPNGKIDRKALPEPVQTTYKEIVSTRNEIDDFLITELKSALNLNEISIEDSFFDIGGDSLTAINLCTKISNRYNVNFSVKDIFANPIIRNISDSISIHTKGKLLPPIQKVSKKNYYKVSSAQKRIYYSSKIAGESSILYNMPGVIIFDEMPNLKKLNDCLNYLAERHSVLRTYFEVIDGEIYQKVCDTININISEITKQYDSIDEIVQNFIKPFDLSRAPLLRCAFTKNNGKYLLLFDMHHIISDGHSINILSKEISVLYNNQQLQDINFDYIDYTYYINNMIQNKLLENSKEYWLKMFENSIPKLLLPYDYKRPKVRSSRGSKVYTSIDDNLSAKVYMLSKELNVSNFIILLAAYYILLNKYSNSDDIVIGTPVIGRDKEEFQNVIGMFVNTLPLRKHINNNSSFIQFVDELKDLCVNAFEHQLYPFDEMIKDINTKRDSSRNPLFDVMFTYQNNGIASLSFDNLNTALYIPDLHIAKFDLSLEVIPIDKHFKLNFEYCIDLFNEKTIQHFMEQYIKILQIVLDNINVQIKNIDVLTVQEKQKLRLMDRRSLSKEWILRFPNIQDVFVRELQDNQNRSILIAYIVANDRIPITNLRAYLRKNLPNDTVPSYFIIVKSLPYLSNNMIDEMQLPLPKSSNFNVSVTYYPPRTSLELKIANIFSSVLGISPISIKDNFFELGGDSLMAMKLQVELMKVTKSITYSDIYMHPTVEELASQIDKYINIASSNLSYDFSKFKSVLDNNLVLDTNIIKKDIGNLFLTGSTGFLGAHILDSYLSNCKEGKIYCLIREEPGLTPKQKLLNKLHFYFDKKYDNLIGSRIKIIIGDIEKDNLGLSVAQLKDLANNISCVVNSAAIVSHYGDYSIFKNVNVIGTKNIVRFCETFHKRLYHISTLNVSGNAFLNQDHRQNNIQDDIIFKENNFYINQSLENVYVRSKFEAEKCILEEINNGLNAYILRIGNLMPRMSDGKFQPNIKENAYSNRLLSFINIGMMPDYLLDNYVEFTPVDFCAQAIIKLMQYPSETNRIFHLYNHNHVTIKYLLDLFNDSIKIQVVTNDVFLDKIDNILRNNNSEDLLSGILGDFDKDRKLVYISNIKLNSSFTIHYLRNIGFEWPYISDSYLINFLKLLKGGSSND